MTTFFWSELEVVWAGFGGGFGKCLFLYFWSTLSSIYTSVNTISWFRHYTSHPESFPIQPETVTQIPGDFLLNSLFIVFERGDRLRLGGGSS